MARPASGPSVSDSGAESQPVAEPSQSNSGVTSGVTETVTIGTDTTLTAEVSALKPQEPAEEKEWERGDAEPPPPWQEMMPSALERRLLRLTVEIDDMAAEYRNSSTGRKRRQQIHDYCEKLYFALKNVEDVDAIERAVTDAETKPPEEY